MRHRRKQAKLGVTTSHRRAMLSHIVLGLVEHHRVRTTVDRAKEARRLAERMITLAKEKTLAARKHIISELRSDTAAKKLIDRIGPVFSQVKGGYTRLIRESRRPGDGAQMVFLEWSRDIELEEPKPRAKGKKAEVEEKPKAKKKWEEIPLVKKESLEEEKKHGKEPKKKKEKEIEGEEKKRGGFLTGLRKFFKGEK